MVTRRKFLGAIAAALPSAGAAARLIDAAAASSMRFAYAAITWGNDVTQAIDDISAVGFAGIQLRAGDGTVTRYAANIGALRDRLAERRLAFAVLSSGNLSTDPARERETLEAHTRNARFVRDAGGAYLQVIDERPKGRALASDDYARVGRLLTELGKRTSDVGVVLVYHHHMNSTGEKPHEVAAVLEAADRKHVRLLFDVAHYQQGGGDPVAAIRQYREWIEVVHLKDVRATAATSAAGTGGSGRSSGPDYEFVELGRGRVDLPGVFKALTEINFASWAIVELDRVPDPGRTPKQSAEMNKKFITGQGFTV
jgi:inosose dehydratase